MTWVSCSESGGAVFGDGRAGFGGGWEVVEAVDRRRGGSEGTSAGMERLVVEAREGR